MSRSRLVVFSSFLMVALGVVAAVGALYLDPARAAVGPVPPEGLVLPAETRFLVGIDVQRFVQSPLYQRHLAKAGSRPQPFVELEEKTGLNPERDVDLVLLAGTQREAGVVLVRGRFDQYKVARTIETSRKGVVSRKHQGLPMYVHEDGGRGTAVAFLGDEVLVLGTQASVEATIDSQVTGTGGLKGNAALVGLLRGLKPGSTVWMVGDQSLLAELPRNLPAAGMGRGESGPQAPPVALPALKSVVATGDLDPEVAFQITAEAVDEAGARNLADVVRGLVALASLQASQKPELKGLASAVSVDTEGARVHLSARLPYEALDALQAKPAPRARPSGQ